MKLIDSDNLINGQYYLQYYSNSYGMKEVNIFKLRNNASNRIESGFTVSFGRNSYDNICSQGISIYVKENQSYFMYPSNSSSTYFELTKDEFIFHALMVQL